jgi:hypothetical protein
MSITVKMRCTAKLDTDAGDGSVSVVFSPDYQQADANTAWSANEPTASVTVAVNAERAADYALDRTYDVTITDTTDGADVEQDEPPLT